MANPTVSELMNAVHAAVTKISAAQARAFLKSNNIRSLGKIDAAVDAAGLKGKTKEELAEVLGDAGDEEFPQTTKAAGKKAASKGGAKKTVARTGTKARRTASVVTAGPRGFRYGEVWNESVKSGEGVAFNAANINKLHAHAESLGVTFDKRVDDVAKIAKAIARKL